LNKFKRDLTAVESKLTVLGYKLKEAKEKMDDATEEASSNNIPVIQNKLKQVKANFTKVSEAYNELQSKRSTLRRQLGYDIEDSDSDDSDSDDENDDEEEDEVLIGKTMKSKWF
jgi:predicted transcriptional regulator